jgi:hypothetical protein
MRETELLGELPNLYQCPWYGVASQYTYNSYQSDCESTENRRTMSGLGPAGRAYSLGIGPLQYTAIGRIYSTSATLAELTVERKKPGGLVVNRARSWERVPFE